MMFELMLVRNQEAAEGEDITPVVYRHIVKGAI
jgi:hypothetical protein